MPFTITTVNQPNQFAIFSENLTIPDPGGATEAQATSSTVATPLPIKHKFLVELTVTETSASNGSLDVDVEGSIDEENWVTLHDSAGLALDSTSEGAARAFVDLADQNVPYFRFRVYTDGTDTGDSIDVTLKFAVQPSQLERSYPRR